MYHKYSYDGLRNVQAQYRKQCVICPKKGTMERIRISIGPLGLGERERSACDGCPIGKELRSIQEEMVRRRKRGWDI
ncbi:MAG: hypothetical protein E3J86_13550 [Candidatus Thorarchaeota archaeon]|nr:MAG: hypothetical protein E3J86_13550 [Candidatus Thorarchaeota archaeon]